MGDMCRSTVHHASASFIASVPFMLIVCYTALWRARLDPIYTPLQCKQMGEASKDFSFDPFPFPGVVNVHEVANYRCDNSNPYVVEVTKGSGGMVLVSTMTEIGQVEVPKATWERDGDGVLSLRCNIHLHGVGSAREVTKLLEGPQDVIQNTTISTRMLIPFLFFEIPQVMTQRQICGKKINILTNQESALNCADSFAELQIADFDADASMFMMKTTRRVLADSVWTRDLATGGIITVSIALTVMLLVYGSVAARGSCGSSREAADDFAETDDSDHDILIVALGTYRIALKKSMLNTADSLA